MSYTVTVADLAPTTTKQSINDFFTFCGRIDSIDFQETEPKKATVHFEKASAAKTALMLNGGTLDGAHLTVTSDTVHADTAEDTHTDPTGEEPFNQADKPRAAIAAEYLAKGYVLSDHILNRAIDIDKKQGISERFLSYFRTFDTSVGAKVVGEGQTVSGKVTELAGGATARARTIDEQRGLSKTATDYYTSAISSPFGQKVLSFYTTTSKQALDIHEEAKRIADAQKAAAVPLPE